MIVVAERIDIAAVRAALHRRRGHDHGMLQRVDEDAHIDELARPELQLGIVEGRLDLHRAGCLVDLIVDDEQGAGVDDRRIVGVERLDFDRSLGHGAVDRAELLLRQIEDHRDRLNLSDHDDAIRIGGMDDIAGIDGADAGAPIDGRADGRIVERGFGTVYGGLVGLQLGRELRHGRRLRVGLLL